MRLFCIGRRLSVRLERHEIWIGVRIDVTHVYVCPLPLLALRWARGNACEYENHHECTGCGCYCHQPRHTCAPFDEPEQRRADCQACRDEAAKGDES